MTPKSPYPYWEERSRSGHRESDADWLRSRAFRADLLDCLDYVPISKADGDYQEMMNAIYGITALNTYLTIDHDVFKEYTDILKEFLKLPDAYRVLEWIFENPDTVLEIQMRTFGEIAGYIQEPDKSPDHSLQNDNGEPSEATKELQDRVYEFCDINFPSEYDGKPLITNRNLVSFVVFRRIATHALSFLLDESCMDYLIQNDFIQDSHIMAGFMRRNPKNVLEQKLVADFNALIKKFGKQGFTKTHVATIKQFAAPWVRCRLLRESESDIASDMEKTLTKLSEGIEPFDVAYGCPRKLGRPPKVRDHEW